MQDGVKRDMKQTAVGVHRMAIWCLLLSTVVVGIGYGEGEERSIGVYVALADNQHQGIVPVPEKIGNGEDPENNLYWGAAEGLKGVFDRSEAWSPTPEGEEDEKDAVLRSRTYRHKDTGTILHAMAYRGDSIRTCIEDFETAVRLGAYGLVVFIGHNGLMDFSMPVGSRTDLEKPPTDCIVLCCRSEAYFKDRLIEQGGRPILMTRQLMYPGSFILSAVIEDWLNGAGLIKIREAAAHAYALNQKISEKSSLGVFSDLDAP